MAKTTFPVNAGGGALKKVFGILFALAILWLVIKFPADAAVWVTGLAHLAGDAINGIGTFLHHVVA